MTNTNQQEVNVHDPLTPPDCDLRDFPYMPLDITRLLNSEFHAIASPEQWRAGVLLWIKGYHQIPAASLPDNDEALARMAEYGRDVKGWKKVRSVALHGWVKCSDDRLYHPIVAEKALEAWLAKLTKRKTSAAANAKRWKIEFDPADIDAAIQQAGSYLRVLNPNSRVLARRVPLQARQDSGSDSIKESRCDPAAIPDGLPAGVPDPSNGESIERGRGTGTLTGNNKTLEREPPDGGHALDPPKKPRKPRTAKSAFPTDEAEIASLRAKFIEDAARKRNLPATRAETEFERFADHHRAMGNIRADWPASGRTWLDRMGDFASRQNGGGVAMHNGRPRL
jgi:hypothetical protein